MKRNHDRAYSHIVIRILLLKARSDRFHLSLRLFQCDAGFHSRDHFQEMITTLRGFLRRERNRYPELITDVFVARQLHQPRHYTHDRVTLAVERKGSANDGWVGSEAPLPQTRTENDDPRSGRVLRWQKSAAELRLHAEDVEKIRGDAASIEPFRFADDDSAVPA